MTSTGSTFCMFRAGKQGGNLRWSACKGLFHVPLHLPLHKEASQCMHQPASSVRNPCCTPWTLDSCHTVSPWTSENQGCLHPGAQTDARVCPS
eukprot:1147686-Pelagomonas_calceolata.AAC.1